MFTKIATILSLLVTAFAYAEDSSAPPITPDGKDSTPLISEKSIIPDQSNPKNDTSQKKTIEATKRPAKSSCGDYDGPPIGQTMKMGSRL